MLQTRELEKARRKHAKASHDTDGLHKIRTRARRLRSALEDLAQCTCGEGAFLSEVKRLGDRTGKARDAQVLLERLQRYRQVAGSQERAEVDRLITRHRKQVKKWNKAALSATAAFRVPPEFS